MPDRANDPLPEAPDLSETAQAIARGRDLSSKPVGWAKRRTGRSKRFRPPSSRQIASSTARTSSWVIGRRAARPPPQDRLRKKGHDTERAHMRAALLRVALPRAALLRVCAKI